MRGIISISCFIVNDENYGIIWLTLAGVVAQNIDK